MAPDAAQIKEKIMYILRTKGPSLPVHISKEIGSDILFSSAFLSELLSEKVVKVSHMRVGNSPIYFLSSQENLLEKFSNYLKSREKEAFLLLKEKKFLNDKEQLPAIRIALREIRDFAIPFNSNGDVVWRYFLVPEEQFIKDEPIIKKQEEVIEVEEKEIPKTETTDEIIEEKQKRPIKKVKKKKEVRKDESFFTNIKEFMSLGGIELLDIENFGSKEIVLKVRENGEEKLLIAYNKNKIAESDILKASKKAEELKLRYIIIGKGGVLKKLDNLISAIKSLSSIEKVK